MTVKVPLRIDFAGGTLDISPLFLLHNPAPVINAAITLYATVTIESARKLTIISKDQNATASFKNWNALDARRYPKLELLIRAAKLFPLPKNICITVNSEAPHGSGLGASSAIAVALVVALGRWTGRRLPRAEIVEYAKSIETQTIKVPTGYQDYWAAVYRGLKIYRMGLGGKVTRTSITKRSFLRNIEDHLLLVYSGKPHFSGSNNWELFKKYFDGDHTTGHFFTSLAENARRMEKAMKHASIREVAEAMNQDWHTRKAMLPSMTTPTIERLSALAFRHGALALRVCGAGGGGCVAILVAPRKRRELAEEISKMGMQVFEPKIT